MHYREDYMSDQRAMHFLMEAPKAIKMPVRL